jgi:hypothetical protein
MKTVIVMRTFLQVAVTASEAKQSCQTARNFRIASSLALPCANASRLSQAVTLNLDTDDNSRLIVADASATIEQ